MEWRLIYKDINGIEESVINNDGRNLTTCLRGVRFEGSEFDSLEPDEDSDSLILKSFTLSHNQLCNCEVECFIDILVVEDNNMTNGILKVFLELGNQLENGSLDKENLILTLIHKGETLKSSGKSGFFEDELLDIQNMLPENTYMKTCINCAYSDYSPYGNGCFGYIMCFRNIKQEYLCVKSKNDFWKVHDRYDRLVQETYICNEFERRLNGTVYRG